MSEYMKPYIAVARGSLFLNLLEPNLAHIHVGDIAKSLANICRFTGHAGAYTVAQHSVLASTLVEPPHQLCALMHDASEYALGDVSSPLKQLLPQYQVLEDRWDRAIAQRFNMPYPRPPEVHEADRRAFKIEVHGLFEYPWIESTDDAVVSLDVLTHEQAETAFLQRFFELGGRHYGG